MKKSLLFLFVLFFHFSFSQEIETNTLNWKKQKFSKHFIPLKSNITDLKKSEFLVLKIQLGKEMLTYDWKNQKINEGINKILMYEDRKNLNTTAAMLTSFGSLLALNGGVLSRLIVGSVPQGTADSIEIIESSLWLVASVKFYIFTFKLSKRQKKEAKKIRLLLDGYEK